MKKRISMLLSALLALSVLTASMTSCLEETAPDDDDTTVEENESAGDGDKEDADGSTLNGKTPEELYVEALSLVNESTNWEIVSTQDIDMTMQYNGESQTAKQTQIIEQKMNGSNIYCKIGGSALEMETWYVDGVLYTITGDVKAKAELSLEEYQAQMPGSTEQTLLHIPEDWFEGVEFEKKGDKNCLSFHVSGEEYAKVVGNLLDSMGAGADAQIGEVDYTVIFDENGNIESIVCDFSANISADGVAVIADYHTVSTVKLGGVDAITAPADGDSYIDVTEQMKG